MVKGRLTGIDTDQYPQEVSGFVGGLWLRPENTPVATVILSHGAGAPMDSPFMQQFAQTLAARGFAVLRFEFPYMAKRRLDGVRRPPDRQPVLLDCWRQCYESVRRQVAGPILLAGKSMGGRMASLLADELAVDGLLCLGYPFHPPAKPEKLRTEHLLGLKTPSLIVQGERDPFGCRSDVEGYALSSSIELYWLAEADHDLKPLKRSGFSHEQYIDRAAQVFTEWFARRLVA